MIAALVAAVLLSAQARAAPPPPPGAVVAGVRVQGNAVTPDADVIRLSGLEIGAAVDAGTTQRAAAALQASGRFEHVQVLQRFASLSDPTAVLIVIIVDEGPLKVTGEGAGQQIVRSGGPHLLFMPVLAYEEGYGLSYGARFAKADPVGGSSRLSFPLTWGGDKRAGAEVSKSLAHGPFTRLEGSLSASRRTNPFFDADEGRVQADVRAERRIATGVTAGASGAAARVSFLGAHDRVIEGGFDVTVDTRLDPMLARNAVYGRAAWERVRVSGGISANRTSLEARGYVGLIGQSILVVRALRDGADAPLPSYMKPLLGGMDTLRGFAAGYKAGDTIVVGSAELRVPLTSPLHIAKFGVRAFTDVGTAYQHGDTLSAQHLDRGVGGGIWFAATVLRLNLDIAHGIGAATHVHFGTSLTF